MKTIIKEKKMKYKLRLIRIKDSLIPKGQMWTYTGDFCWINEIIDV